jgi:iron-sulfur cluster repair protein YtfE (RIC family)
MEKSNPIHLLKDDHKKLLGLFRQYQALDQRANPMQAGVADEIFMELEIHSRVEEELFYPAARQAQGAEIEGLVEGSLDAHHQIRESIAELRKLSQQGSDYRRQVLELIEQALPHLQEEESVLFRLVEAHFDQPAHASLGQQMKHRRDELLKAPEYRSSQAEQVQNPSGGEQKRRTGSAA